MKTSLIIAALLILNTSALLSEPLAALLKGVSPWLLLSAEVVLLLIFYINKQLNGLKEIANLDLSGFDLFVVRPKNKTQGKP